MFKYLWLLTLVVIFLFIIVLTCNAVIDIMKNEMDKNDGILDFIECFGLEYPGLIFIWEFIIGGVTLLSLICWIASIIGW